MVSIFSLQTLPREYKLNTTSFVNLLSFSIINGSLYYVADGGTQLVSIYDIDWNLQETKLYSDPFFYLTGVDTIIFISGTDKICKTDLDLNEITCTIVRISSLHSMFFDKVNQKLYSTSLDFGKIYVFDSELSQKNEILVLGGMLQQPIYTINGYDNKLIATTGQKVLIIENNVVSYDFDVACNKFIPQLLVDNNGFIITNCESPSAKYLYDINGTSFGTSSITTDYPHYFDYDLNGNRILLTATGIYVLPIWMGLSKLEKFVNIFLITKLIKPLSFLIFEI